MKRGLLIHRDQGTGQYVHRYGDLRGRVTVTKPERGLTPEDLAELDVGLDLVIEGQATVKAKEVLALAEQVAAMLIARFDDDASVRIDTRLLH